MTFRKLQEISRPHYYCLIIDNFLSKKIRDLFRSGSIFLALISFVISFYFPSLISVSTDGLFFIFVFVYLIFFFIEVFYRSMLNEGIQVFVEEKSLDRDTTIDYSLSDLIFKTDEIDVSRALFESRIGLQIMLRLGIPSDSIVNFLSNSRSPLIASTLNFDSQTVNLSEYLSVVYDFDKELKSFLSKNSINREEFLGTVEWIMNREEKKRRKNRFWGRENLGRIPSIGTSWSYGTTSDLGKFGTLFERISDVSSLDIENGYREREINLLESVLEKRQDANTIIIDDDENVSRDIVGRLVKKIKLGISPPSIEHKNVIELDWISLTASFKNKTDLEREIIKLFNEAVTAGNIILYIRDLPSFISSVKGYGINMGTILFPYLNSGAIQIIASATNADFHFFIETNVNLLQKFERIIPDTAGVESSIPPLLEQLPSIENQYGTIFSYPSILAIANSAIKYISYGEMPSKAIDMMVEIAPWARERGVAIITESLVSDFVSKKTGITTGEIKESEAFKIENLEALIHKRIVGQDLAVKGITSAIRRARSGVANSKRPISSFLFIGPTGVGKTEVSKALAESFFGDEKNMIRFDMSEYSGVDAIGRLIGDFALNKSGLLASKIRDNPYSVLLLDELEKSSSDVLDLFLQVLDEGIFTDATGKQVMCRNLIIIATSNAGSQYIWDAVKSGNSLDDKKDEIINKIIKDSVFKPELINRFDGVILFHPLDRDELKDVSIMAVDKLRQRLYEKDIELTLTDEAINYLVDEAKGGEFGGREINRIVQNKIEDLVARRIVSGEVSAGSKIVVDRKDLEEK